MSPLNITQPLDSIRYMVYNGYFFRWCPIFPFYGTFNNPCFWPALPPRPQPHCTWQSSIGISTLAYEGGDVRQGTLGFFERHQFDVFNYGESYGSWWFHGYISWETVISWRYFMRNTEFLGLLFGGCFRIFYGMNHRDIIVEIMVGNQQSADSVCDDPPGKVTKNGYPLVI